jgi:hypothetical protein
MLLQYMVIQQYALHNMFVMAAVKQELATLSKDLSRSQFLLVNL